MKAILIDPFLQKITEVEYTGDFKQIYKFIHADCFCTVQVDDRNDIFVDDNGLFQTPNNQKFKMFFKLPKIHADPLAGYGLCLGYDDMGESTATTITVKQLERSIMWLTPLEVTIASKLQS